LGAALELFFESLCEASFEEVRESNVKYLLDFFTNPDLEELVKEKLLKTDENK
jgi:hypothetical protein